MDHRRFFGPGSAVPSFRISAYRTQLKTPALPGRDLRHHPEPFEVHERLVHRRWGKRVAIESNAAVAIGCRCSTQWIAKAEAGARLRVTNFYRR
jgi:hypothetical protein